MKKINAFLSHNSDDKPAVERIALRLKDEKDIEPNSWQSRLMVWNKILANQIFM